jgi:glucose-1-phosphate cytidylyltransferase
VIKEYFADYYLFRSDVTFDFAHGGEMTIHSNVSEPWRVTVVDTGLDTQTGGRVRRIEKFVEDEPFFLTYGDGVSNIDLDAILRQHENSDKTVTLSAIQPGGRFGVLDISADSETVTGFKEKAKEDGGWINAGFMVCEQGIFDYLDGDETILERTPMQRLSADGKLGVYRHDGYWQCMDTQRDKDRLNAAWRSGKAPWKVW